MSHQVRTKSAEVRWQELTQEPYALNASDVSHSASDMSHSASYMPHSASDVRVGGQEV